MSDKLNFRKRYHNIVFPAEQSEKTISSQNYQRYNFSRFRVNLEVICIAEFFAAQNIDYLFFFKFFRTNTQTVLPLEKVIRKLYNKYMSEKS